LEFAEAIDQLLVHMAAVRGLSENYQRLTRRSLTKFTELLAVAYPGKGLRTVRTQLTEYLKQEHDRGMASAPAGWEPAEWLHSTSAALEQLLVDNEQLPRPG
jgi:site-specific recombinase XerD